MSKLAIILCFAVFATVANSLLLPSKFQRILTSVESIVASAISAIKERFEPAKEKALDKLTKLEEAASKFSQKLVSDVTAEIKKARERVKSITERVKGINVSKCTALVNELDSASTQLYSEAGGCAVEKVKIGANYVDNMRKNTDIMTQRLSELQEEASRCGKNVTGPRSALRAVACVKVVSMKAAWTAAKAVPSITGFFAKIDYLLATLRVSLSQCSATKALGKFSSYAKDVIKRVEKCVQQQLSEGNKKPPKDETTQPPKTTPTTTDSSTSGSGKGSTTPSFVSTTESEGSTAKPSKQPSYEDTTTSNKDRTTESSPASTEEGSTTPSSVSSTESGSSSGTEGSTTAKPSTTTEASTTSAEKGSTSRPDDATATVTSSGRPEEEGSSGDSGAGTPKPSEQSTDKDSVTKKESTTEVSTAGTEKSPSTQDSTTDSFPDIFGDKVSSGAVESGTSKPSEQNTDEDASTTKKDDTTESSKPDSTPKSQNDYLPDE